MVIPTIGNIVYYTLAQQDVDAINSQRADGSCRGNPPVLEAVYPMMITSTHGNDVGSYVNGQVFLDGDDTIWVTSVCVGEGYGTFAWTE